MKTMKKFKKLVCAAITATMVMAMAVVPALADTSDYTITVENSVGGSTYSAYKIFDATGSGDNVSYTISSDSAWYATVSAATDVFTLTQGSTSTYYVTVNEGVSDAAVIAVFSEVPDGAVAAVTATGTGSSITLDVGESGYYYVTTTTGATASITTALPTATIMDKNQTPGKGGSDPNDPDWDGSFSKDADEGNYSIGDTIEYEIKTYAPTYDGTEKIYSYTITDTMGEGLTYDEDSIVVKLIGSGLTDYVDITDQCTIECKDGVLTITWSPLDITDYPSDAVITIDYTDTVNEKADATDVTNDVHMTWYKVKAGTEDDPQPDTDNPGSTGGDDNPDPNVTVYTYGFDLKKINKSNEVLEGAQFSLADSEGNLIAFLYDENSDTYEVWDGIASGETTTTITVSDGELNVWGLGAGTYTLTELVAPDGYNLLTSPVTITITETETGWTVTADGTNSSGTFGEADDGHGVTAMPTISVVNASGTILPGTGGMGTALIIIIGCAIVACGAAVVASRRRKVA